MLTRLPQWQSSLGLYLTESASQRFRYGVLDCGLFVGNAIHAMTGVDVAEPLRGLYTNRAEAFSAIKELCGKPTMQAVSDYLAGLYEIRTCAVSFAQRGDPVLLRYGRASSLGIIAMHGTELLTPYKDGLLRLPLSHATRAWHI